MIENNSKKNIFNISVRCIDDTKNRVTEGVLRSEELEKYLDRHKTSKTVWLSEDATAIVPKIKYDSATNQLVGILLPTNKNGCPTPFRYSLSYFKYSVDRRTYGFFGLFFSFIAKDAKSIEKYVREPYCKSVYVIMAQALNENVPPFILQMFGTNGQFTACDVIRRWNYTKSELEKYVNIVF